MPSSTTLKTERLSSASLLPLPSKWSHQSSWKPTICHKLQRMAHAQRQVQSSPLLALVEHSLMDATWTQPDHRKETRRPVRKLRITFTCGSTLALSPNGCHPTSSCTLTWTTILPRWPSSDLVSSVWRSVASGVQLVFSGRDHSQLSRSSPTTRSPPRCKSQSQNQEAHRLKMRANWSVLNQRQKITYALEFLLNRSFSSWNAKIQIKVMMSGKSWTTESGRTRI